MHRNRIVMVLSVVVWLAAVSMSLAIDQIRMIADENGKEETYRGRITSMSPDEVVIDVNGVPNRVAVNRIKYIQMTDEPIQLFNAHKQLLDGEFEEALANLEKIEPDQVKKPELQVEIDYYKAYCEAKLAMGGSLVLEGGKNPLQETGRKLIGFLKANPRSYHFYEANEMVGDLLVANGNYQAAEPYFAALNKAPWGDYRMRAAVAMGRALLAQDKFAEAAKAFDEVIAGVDTGALAEGQRQIAKLGKARCLAATAKADQAVKIIQDIIAKADADNPELHAQAYNALGTALRKAKKPKEALLAFLHTELLYSNSPDAHAEALANLEALFTELHKPEHARRARATLDEKYSASRWAAGAK